MKTILVIFRKELKDTLRDRRTLVSMLIIPLVLIPLLMGISSRIMFSQIEKAKARVLTVGLMRDRNAEEFRTMLLKDPRVRVLDDLPLDSARARFEADSLDAYFAFAPDFDRMVDSLGSGEVAMYFKSTEQRDIETGRAKAMLTTYEDSLRARRLRSLHLSASLLEPVVVREVNVASAKEKIAEVIGGFLPYLFIIFCFMGSMYPAIDLAAGEKERGTLETLLTSPASKMEILLGKVGVVILTGITTAAVALIGMYLGIVQVRELPPELLKTVMDILQVRSIVLLLSLLLPLTILFSGVLLSLSIVARSYKEAQSIISPAIIVVIIPAFIGLMPGISLDSATALVPILNVSLATKAIISDTVTPWLLAEVYLSSVVLAGLSLFMCSRIFEHESTLFRGT